MQDKSMRDIVIEHMRSVAATNRYGPPSYNFTRPLIELPYAGAGYKHSTNALFIATLWELVAEGLIVPGDASSLREGQESRQTWPYYTITPRGQEMLDGKESTTSPHDAVRYLNEAEHRLPNADPEVGQYLAESNRAFIAGLYLASVTMLGVSAEALMEWLIKLMKTHLANQPGRLTKFNDDLQAIGLKTSARFDRVFSEIRAHSGEFKKDLHFIVNTQLETVLGLLKTYRDDVAHLRPQRIDSQLADGQLRIYLATLSVSAELAQALAAPCSLP